MRWVTLNEEWIPNISITLIDPTANLRAVLCVLAVLCARVPSWLFSGRPTHGPVSGRASGESNVISQDSAIAG